MPCLNCLLHSRLLGTSHRVLGWPRPWGQMPIPYLETGMLNWWGTRERMSVWLKANFAVGLEQKRSRMVNWSFIPSWSHHRISTRGEGSEHKGKEKALFGSKAQDLRGYAGQDKIWKDYQDLPRFGQLTAPRMPRNANTTKIRSWIREPIKAYPSKIHICKRETTQRTDSFITSPR